MMFTLLWVPTCSLHTHTHTQAAECFDHHLSTILEIKPPPNLHLKQHKRLPVDGPERAEGPLHVFVKLSESIFPPEPQ